ncbi:MAG: bacillithiol biosynthesis cysteine-adding enzyme BshC [Calditrichales bacterium]|nr:MAG: bacillithiol biosynthesis cysteine-adding enzyme BshC [Calditrichales bacterium]
MKNYINLPLYNSFYTDYIHLHPQTEPFLHPLKKESIPDLARSISAGTAHYLEMKQILASQNADLDSEKAHFYRKKLAEPDTLILITGQQLGFFASPLYTIYKIITTIKLAEHLNQISDTPTYVPVFWLESEDHDFKEINHVGIMDKSFHARRITYGGTDRGKTSLRHYQIEPSIDPFLNEIGDSLFETEFTQTIFEQIKANYYAGNDWIDAIRGYLKVLFKKQGILFFQPGDSSIKQLSVNFFDRLLSQNISLAAAFTEGSNQLRAAGYHNQVTDIPDKTFIHFEVEDKQRAHVYRRDKEFYLKDTGREFSENSARQFIEEDPQRVSTSVVSRPLLQSWLLPVAAYVAGPAEVAYWAQLSKMFAAFDLAMPVVYPRITATVLEPKILRHLNKHSIGIDALQPKKEQFISDYFQTGASGGKKDPLNKLKDLLAENAKEIENYLKSLDPTLVDAADKTFGRIDQAVNNLESRVINAKKQKESQLTDHLAQIHAAFFPNEMPQERFLTIVYFLNKYGMDFMDQLFSNLEINQFEHQVFSL